MHILAFGVVFALASALCAIQATVALPVLMPPQEIRSTPTQPPVPVLLIDPPVTIPLRGPVGAKNLDIPTASPSDVDALLDPTEIFPDSPAGSFQKRRSREDPCKEDCDDGST